jgi:hypothetical protein
VTGVALDRPGASRLAALARAAARPAPEAPERCDLCGEPVPGEHRHLLDVRSGELMCACRACKILFDRGEASDGHYRLVPERRWRIDGFDLDDARWESLRIPVDIAYFFHSSPAGRVRAYYPSPMGATESLLELETWGDLEHANPIVSELEPDVEALLVNRSRGARDHWLVPIDDCYRLVAAIRTRWRGFSGGREVWEELERFFDAMAATAETRDRKERT